MLAMTQISGFGLGEWTPATTQPLIWVDALTSKQFTERTGASATTPATVGASVGTIENAGTMGQHFTAPSDTQRPVLSESSGQRWWQHDGSNDYLSVTFGSSLVSGSAPSTLAVAFRGNSGTGKALSLGDTTATVFASREVGYRTGRPDAGINNSDHTAPAGTSVDGINRVVVWQLSGTASRIWVDASLVHDATLTTPNSATPTARLGARHQAAGEPLNGRIYAALMWARALSDGELRGVQRYLAARSGVTL